MSANVAIISEISAIMPIIFSIFCKARLNLHFLSVTRKKTEAKERARKRPELGGRKSSSCGMFSKDLSEEDMKCGNRNVAWFVQALRFVACYRWDARMFLREKGRNLKNIPHKEVFRDCTILRIFFDSCVAKRDKQIDMRCCLSEASSSNNS